jgi:phage gpG-like protein
VSVAVQIKISNEAEALLQRFNNSAALSRTVVQAMRVAMEGDDGLKTHIITKHLNAQPHPSDPSNHELGRVTSRLANSVYTTTAATATGVESHIGSNVKYAAIHEYGFNGNVMVAGHIRKRSVMLKFLAAEEKLKFKKPKREKGERPASYDERVFEAERIFNLELSSRTRGTVQRKVRVGDVTVRTHQRQMNMPERSPFRTGIAEKIDFMGKSLSDAIVWHLMGIKK